MAEITLKGQPLSDWEDWIINEISPPFSPSMSGEWKYTLEAFLELIEKVKNT